MSTEQNEVKELIADFSFDNNVEEAQKILSSGACTHIILKSTYVTATSTFSPSDDTYKKFYNAFIGASRNKHLNNLKIIELEVMRYFELLSDEFYKSINRLPQLHTVILRRCSLWNKDFLHILNTNTSIERMEIHYLPIGREIDIKQFKEAFASSNIKELSLFNCQVTDSVLEALSTSKTLKKLDLTQNQPYEGDYRPFTSKGLEDLAKNCSIIDLNLSCTPFNMNGTLALIRANQLQSLADPIGEFCFTLDVDGKYRAHRHQLTQADCKLLDEAFYENTSLLRTGIKSLHDSYYHSRWHPQYPCRSFRIPVNEADRALSDPLQRDDFRYPEAYTYTPRNLALKAACESLGVFNAIRGSILAALERCPAGVVPIIAAYAQPNGKELVQMFSKESAEQLFPAQLGILRQFGLFLSDKNEWPKAPAAQVKPSS